MSIFCDDHEWVGEQGQSCPECDGLWSAARSPAADVMNSLSKRPILGGINVTMSEALPRNTMVVSRDIFEMLRGAK